MKIKNIFEKNKRNLSQNSKSKKSLSDYTFYINSAKQVSDYDATMWFIINHIKKSYSYRNDSTDAIRTLTKPYFDK